mmetsp:Transcript_84642/g.234701  ORF Transcript_84642/g.234701 Transcript_84642/m.234701 type:complete len:84 (+) Transcript_84642:71-322(+)
MARSWLLLMAMLAAVLQQVGAVTTLVAPAVPGALEDKEEPTKCSDNPDAEVAGDSLVHYQTITAKTGATLMEDEEEDEEATPY